MQKVVRKLCELHEQPYALLTGSGTAAIYSILKLLGPKPLKVGIPNSVCFNVVLPIINNGHIPIYLDIDEKNMKENPEGENAESELIEESEQEEKIVIEEVEEENQE